MASQPRSQFEPAALSNGFQGRITRSGIGASGYAYDKHFEIPFADYLGPPAFDVPVYQDEHQPRQASPATPSAPPTEFTTPVDFDIYSSWDYDTCFEYARPLESDHALAVDQQLGLPPSVEFSQGIPDFPRHGLEDLSNRLPTPALTQASSPEAGPNQQGRLGTPAATPPVGGIVRPQRLPGEETLVCGKCQRVVKGARSLARHDKEVHGPKGYRCRCGYSCARKSNCRRHLRSCKLLNGNGGQSHPQELFFTCLCGMQHLELAAHQGHIADCGRQKVGRPARRT